MTETQLEILQRIKAEAIEARQHPCNTCGHAGSKHAFDIFRKTNSKTCPCAISCMECFDIQTKELEQKKK